jgi:GTP diphosphokinase / guanosine-3',5'-bis(diphosphate) 3'-diphosphatase
VEKLRSEFLERAEAAYGPEESRRVSEALAWAEELHSGKLRASGEGAWSHDLRVADILLGLGLDADSVIAGLLHDALDAEALKGELSGESDAAPGAAQGAPQAAAGEGEQAAAQPAAPQAGRKRGKAASAERARAEAAETRKAALSAEISKRLGSSVALLVEDTSRLAALRAKNKTVHAAETIRKMLFAMARDLRVIIIKLADKLDSMRTLKYLEEERQKEIAAECLDIYAPLADRLGISWMKDELEDLSLKAINREAFDQIKDIVAAKKGERESFLKRVEDEIRAAAGLEGVEVEASARAKHFYSIYQKMRKRAKGAEELFDLLGLRLICATENECYALLGMVHRLWKPMDGRFKDYIAMPKSNGYRSLHTTVMCYEGRLLEVQIRTREMHRVAEYGVASHWLYKKGSAVEAPRPEELTIVSRLKEWSDFVSQGAVYLEEIRRELLKDSIFVFTPRGDVIELPSGSTPLDFAFAIHSDIGIHCLGAKADGQIVPLDAELVNTQVVEVLTSPQARPNMNWLKIARTSKAKAKIRSWLVQDGEALAIDRNIVAGHRGAPAHPKSGEQAAPPAGQKAPAAAGHGTAQKAPPAGARMTEAVKGTGAHAGAIEYRAIEPGTAVRNDRAGVSIGDAKNMMIRIAGCCQPVTDDDIVGYVSRGRGIIVHRADCRTLHAIPDFAQRRIDVSWEDSAAFVTARFRITARQSPDLFAEIENAVRKFRGRLREGRLGERGDGSLEGSFTMEVETKEDVKRAVKALRAVPSIIALEEDD